MVLARSARLVVFKGEQRYGRQARICSASKMRQRAGMNIHVNVILPYMNAIINGIIRPELATSYILK